MKITRPYVVAVLDFNGGIFDHVNQGYHYKQYKIIIGNHDIKKKEVVRKCLDFLLKHHKIEYNEFALKADAVCFLISKKESMERFADFINKYSEIRNSW